jgi:hypothetical protein
MLRIVVEMVVIEFYFHFTAISLVLDEKYLPLQLQDVRKVWNQREFYLLFTLYALYVHPDTLRNFSAALPCLC